MIYALNTKNIADIKWNRKLYLILDGVLIAFDLNFNLKKSQIPIILLARSRASEWMIIYPPKRVHRIFRALHKCDSDVRWRATNQRITASYDSLVLVGENAKSSVFLSVFIYISNDFYFRFSNKNNIYLRSINESKLTRQYYNNAFQFLHGSALAFS